MRQLLSQMVETHLCPSAYIVLAVVLLPCSGVGWTPWDEGGTFQFFCCIATMEEMSLINTTRFFIFEPIYGDRGWCGAEKGEK